MQAPLLPDEDEKTEPKLKPNEPKLEDNEPKLKTGEADEPKLKTDEADEPKKENEVVELELEDCNLTEEVALQFMEKNVLSEKKPPRGE